METSNHEPRHIFLAIGIILLITIPFAILFVPQTLINIRHYVKGDWHVFTPTESIVAFAIGMLLIFISCLVIFFLDIRKLSIFLSIGFLLLAIVCIYVSSSTFIRFSNEQIAISELFAFEERTYEWTELEGFVRLEEESKVNEFQLVFSDGKKVILPNNAYFLDIRERLFNKIRENNVPIETVKVQPENN